MFIKILQLIFIVNFLSCVEYVYLIAQTDDGFKFKKNVSVYLEPNKYEKSVANNKIYKILTDGLKKNGFILAKNPHQADYVFDYRFFKKEGFTYDYNLFEPNDAYGFVGEVAFTTSDFVPRAMHYSYPYESKAIYFRLFDSRTFLKNDKNPLWQADLVLETNVYYRRIRDGIEVLIKSIGKDHRGRVMMQK